MKKRNILTIILILVITLFKIDVDAASCTSSEKSDLKQLARMIEITPLLNAEKNEWNDYYYEISILNWNENFYIIDSLGNKFYKNDNSDDEVYGLYQPGTVGTFNVYARRGTTCAFEHLATIRVSFPNYNHYYTSPLCEGIEEFYLCQRTYGGKIESYEWFEKQIKEYKESLEEEEPQVKELTVLEKIQKYITENPVVILVAVVATGLIIVIIVRKVQNNKKRIKVDLELK